LGRASATDLPSDPDRSDERPTYENEARTVPIMALPQSMFLLTETRDQPMHVGSLQLFRPPDGAGPEFLREMYAEADLACMRRVREAMDPHGIANTGKKLGPPAGSTASHGLHPLERAGVISRA